MGPPEAPVIELRAGVVRQVKSCGRGRVDLLVEVPSSRGPVRVREAWAFPDLGYPAWSVGQRVLCNTTAVSLGLGTGGRHVVVAPIDPPGGPDGWATPPASRRGGHIVKLRYTPLQLAVMAAEEPAGPYHRALRHVADLRGLPVAVIPLHSMLGPVAAALRWASDSCHPLRLAYVMTDSASLPAPVSHSLEALRRARIVDLVITTGQAFGGDIEAVHPASGLMVAQRAGADAVVVGPGPGVVGTGTALGTTCLEGAWLSDLVAALGGRPVTVPRLSIKDQRVRHRGVSHHDRIALGRLAARRALVVLPASLCRPWRRTVLRQLAESGVLARHRVVEVNPEPVRPALRMLPAPPDSMGRRYEDDPPFFDTCLAAGRIMAALLGEPAPGLPGKGA